MQIQERRKRLAGHIHRRPKLVANQILLWGPTHGLRSREKPAMTYVDSIRTDTGLNDTGEIGGHMADGVIWRQQVLRRRREQSRFIGDAGYMVK